MRVIGFEHGFFKMPRPVREHLAGFFQNEGKAFRIRTEGDDTSPIRRLSDIPKEQQAKVEHPLVTFLAGGALARSFLRLPVRNVYREIQQMRNNRPNEDEVEIVREPPTRKQERQEIREMAEVPANHADVAFAINVRSALMAADMLKRTRPGGYPNERHEDPLALTVGGLHAGAVHRFLENPRFASAYLGRARVRMEREVPWVFRKKFLSIVDDALREFRILLEEQKRAKGV